MAAQGKNQTTVPASAFPPPFRSHPVHGRVFAPWGIWGTQYRMEGGAEHEHLQKRFPNWYSFFFLINLPHFLGGILHLSWIGQFYLGIGIFSSVVAIYALVVRHEARRLIVAEPRLPLSKAISTFAHEQPLWALWLGNLIALLLVALAAALDTPHAARSLAEWFLLGFFILIALTFSGIIFVKQFTSPITARQPVTR